MGLAPYFDKAALSATSLLRGVDHARFRQLLLEQAVDICFDAESAESAEARTTLEFAVELCSRLYPTLGIRQLATDRPQVRELVERLVSRARSINPEIAIGADRSLVRASLVVGKTPVADGGVAVYMGSDGWTASFSTTEPVGSGKTSNPIGAAAAACLGAAAVFRRLFAVHLGGRQIEDETTNLDLRLMQRVPTAKSTDASPLPLEIDIGETFVVGIGAVGNAILWTLARTPGLRGRLQLIDHETLELGNVQRYVLTAAEDVGATKVAVGERAFRDAGRTARGLEVHVRVATWRAFVSSRPDRRFDRVLLAVDTAECRVEAQASLPRWIVNSWTQPANLGISRHFDFLSHPCVGCLYLPLEQRKSADQLYAEALGANSPQELMEIRVRLYDGAPVGQPFIERVASRLQVSVEPLLVFASQPISVFYTQAVCGGLLLRLGGVTSAPAEVEVPMAFQSALAGVLAAAELVADAAGARPVLLPCRTEIDLLRPLGSSLNVPTVKDPTGRCLCHDAVFQRAYASKYVTTTVRGDVHSAA